MAKPPDGMRPIPPGSLMDALWAYDEAMRAHLRDCWLKEDDDAKRIDERYLRYRSAEDLLMNEIRRWVGRHAKEFSEMQRSIDAE